MNFERLSKVEKNLAYNKEKPFHEINRLVVEYNWINLVLILQYKKWTFLHFYGFINAADEFSQSSLLNWNKDKFV